MPCVLKSTVVAVPMGCDIAFRVNCFDSSRDSVKNKNNTDNCTSQSAGAVTGDSSECPRSIPARTESSISSKNSSFSGLGLRVLSLFCCQGSRGLLVDRIQWYEMSLQSAFESTPRPRSRMFDVESIHQIPPATAALADSVDIKDALNSEKAVATQLATEDTIPGQ